MNSIISGPTTKIEVPLDPIVEKKKWIDRADEIPAPRREDYRAQIEKVWCTASVVLNSMSTKQQGMQAISQINAVSISQLQKTSSEIYHNYKNYKECHVASLQRLDGLSKSVAMIKQQPPTSSVVFVNKPKTDFSQLYGSLHKAKSTASTAPKTETKASVPSNPSLAPNKPSNQSEHDFMFAHRKEKMHEYMATARVVATGIKVAETVVEAALYPTMCRLNDAKPVLDMGFKGLKAAGLKICKSSKTARDVAGTTKNAIRKTASAISSTATKISESVTCNSEKRASEISREYGIPKTQTRQYLHDVVDIGSTGALYAVFGTFKPIVSTAQMFKRFGREVTKKIKKPFSASPQTLAVAGKPFTENPIYLQRIKSFRNGGETSYSVEERIQFDFNQFKDFGTVELPDLSWNARESIWLKAAGQTNVKTRSIVSYLQNGDDGIVAKLGNRLIVKDRRFRCLVAEESIGLRYLRSEDFQHLNVPIVLINGTYHAEEQRFFLLKTYAPGMNLVEIVERVGSSTSQSRRRQILSDVTRAINKVGKAVAEVHSKSYQQYVRPRKELIELEISLLEEELVAARSNLAEFGPSFNLEAKKGFSTIVKDFQSAPGGLSRGLDADIGLSQFIWDKKRLTYIDGEFVSKNLIFPASEFYDFSSDLAIKCFSLGLLDTEALTLQKAFTNGYMGISSIHHPSRAAHNFFNIRSNLSTARMLAFNSQIGEPVDIKVLSNLVQSLNQRLK